MKALLSAILLCFVLPGCSDNAERAVSDTEEAGRTPIAAYEVVARDLSRQVTLSAAVEPRIQVHLSSRTQGTVEEVLVEAGDAVERGELLAQFDVREDVLELRRAEAHEEEARLEFERIQQLRDGDTISLAELQRAQAALTVAEAERELWQTRIEFSRIRAPHDAVVTERFIERGESVQNQEPLFELAVMDELVLRPGVSERDVRHLAAGQVVPVQLDAMPDSFVQGRIRRVFPSADSASGLLRIEVLLPADSFAQGVRPGFLGRIPLVIDARPDTLAVPAAAIGEDGDAHYLYLVREQQLVRQPITTGITRGQWTEVLEGISRGDVVLATNPIDMRDGAAVRIVNWRG